MRNADLVRRIRNELEHIPRGERCSPQNLLRMLYNFYRRRQLSRNPSGQARWSLFRALVSTQREYPYFQPSVDEWFFGIRGAFDS
jgi:hypothetical protein